MAPVSFEQRIEKACKNREIPGAVLVGADSGGKCELSQLSHKYLTSQEISVTRDHLDTGVSRTLPILTPCHWTQRCGLLRVPNF
jgi:hypothetical protein